MRYAHGGKSFSLWEGILARAAHRVSLEDTTLREPSSTDAQCSSGAWIQSAEAGWWESWGWGVSWTGAGALGETEELRGT